MENKMILGMEKEDEGSWEWATSIPQKPAHFFVLEY
jgi:hypothetical protein